MQSKTFGISPIKGGYLEQEHICFDVETVTNEDKTLSLNLAVIEAEDFYFNVHDKVTMTQTILGLCSKWGTTFVWAHNAQFDVAFLDFDQLNDYKLVMHVTSPFILMYKKYQGHKTQTIIFCDTLNYFRATLKELGEKFGHEKIMFDVVRTLEHGLIEYCTQDVLITKSIVSFLIDMHIKYDIKMCYTIAMMSMRVFKKQFLKETLYPPNRPDIMQLERDSYFGGRVEVYSFVKYDKAFVYDFNSLYPFVMANTLVPTKVTKYFSRYSCKYIEFEDLKAEIYGGMKRGKGYIVRAIVKVPDCLIAPFPLRTPERLVFPTGTFETVLATPELEIAEDNLVEILEVVEYEMAYLFEDFVSTFHRLKSNSTGALRFFYKIVLNSLYGKFGQRKFNHEPLPELDNLLQFGNLDYITPDNKMLPLNFFNGKAYLRSIEPLNPKSFVAIASHITSAARMRLYHALARNEDKILYCDTDSLFLTEQTEKTGKELGDLVCESIYEELQIHGNKDYEYIGGYKLKGVPKSATLISPNTYEYERITKMREGVRRFKDPIPRIVTVIKHLKRTYDKRERLASGATIPLQSTLGQDCPSESTFNVQPET